MIEIGSFALNLILNLLSGVIQEGVNYTTLPFFERRKIERHIEDATAEVVEPLLPFLTQEKVPEEKQHRLLQTCVDELRPLTQKSERLFQGSLDGEKIFEELYADRNLPDEIIEDGLRDVYALLCPRIATLLCKIPAAVKDWENESWSENYRRLDNITTQLRTLFSRVDELAALPFQQADEKLAIVRRSLAQRVRFKLDLTGLRSDRPLDGNFDDFFIHPEIRELQKDDRLEPHRVGTGDKSFLMFTSTCRPSVVIGTAGAGKSTWTKWLQLETLSRRWTGICVRIELRGYSNEELPSLQKLIREIAGKHQAEHLTAERIEQWLKGRQVIFCLDGFDEIRPGDRDRFYEWIVELQQVVHESPFIITSRPLTTDHLTQFTESGWQDWEIEPFDKSRIVDYIERWYMYTDLLEDGKRVINADELATDWQSDSTIEPLTGNPLLLSTLLMVHHLDGSLPAGRSQLYQRYVEGMLGLWDNRRQVAAENINLTLQQKRQILRGLALKLFLAEQEQMDETEIVTWLDEFLAAKINISFSPIEILDLLRERSGLIVGPGIYSFSHKSIAEFLIAETILQGDQRDEDGDRIDRFMLFKHRDNDRWNTVTFLWAGLAPVADVEEFMEACLNDDNWALGYGILADQYDRIPIEIQKKLLSKANVMQPSFSKGHWIVSMPNTHKDTKLPVPVYRLRKLNSHTNSLGWIRKIINDGIITWSDIDHAHAHQEWKDLLWMMFVKANDINDWESLSLYVPQSATPIHWIYWVAENIILKKDVEKALEAYQRVYSAYRGLLPIALMSRSLSSKDDSQREMIDIINKVLLFLPECDQGHVVPEWLTETRDWFLYGSRSNDENTVDLLTIFIERVGELAQQGHIKRDTTYERAIDYVRELQKRREALNVST